MGEPSTAKSGTPESAAARQEAQIMDVTPHKQLMLPVWFFIGGILLIYGILIFVEGLLEYSDPPIANYHAPVWWGIVMVIVGGIFFQRFYPRKK